MSLHKFARLLTSMHEKEVVKFQREIPVGDMSSSFMLFLEAEQKYGMNMFECSQHDAMLIERIGRYQ